MRKPVTTVTPDTSVRAVAALMSKLDIGIVPVSDSGQLVGVVTDRDIVTRWCPRVRSDTSVAGIMTRSVATCRDDQTIQEVANRMGDLRLRRLLVLDAEDALVGIISLGDIANDASEEIAGQTLGEIVEMR
ncbi:CBS domain-containing protein [Marivita sp. S2033]|uniref:CBS domain-containing protein n=1 Tax=Marivita sp. S2033 TaxID=3373187 RepID=UPI00398281FC